MTAHKHAEMIKAKADNMELVLFSMSTGSDYGKWSECNRSTMPKDSENVKYFLCLPQHKDACLHWLNGGKIQYKTELVPEFQDYQPDIEFGLGSIFMQPDFEIRIKPRKEKRWIRVNKNGKALETMVLFNTLDHARGDGNYQVFEIEVKV